MNWLELALGSIRSMDKVEPAIEKLFEAAKVEIDSADSPAEKAMAVFNEIVGALPTIKDAITANTVHA